jgi:hypothetical protein
MTLRQWKYRRFLERELFANLLPLCSRIVRVRVPRINLYQGFAPFGLGELRRNAQ